MTDFLKKSITYQKVDLSKIKEKFTEFNRIRNENPNFTQVEICKSLGISDSKNKRNKKSKDKDLKDKDLKDKKKETSIFKSIESKGIKKKLLKKDVLASGIGTSGNLVSGNPTPGNPTPGNLVSGLEQESEESDYENHFKKGEEEEL